MKRYKYQKARTRLSGTQLVSEIWVQAERLIAIAWEGGV